MEERRKAFRRRQEVSIQERRAYPIFIYFVITVILYFFQLNSNFTRIYRFSVAISNETQVSPVIKWVITNEEPINDSLFTEKPPRTPFPTRTPRRTNLPFPTPKPTKTPKRRKKQETTPRPTPSPTPQDCLNTTSSPYNFSSQIDFITDNKDTRKQDHYKELLEKTKPFRKYPSHAYYAYSGPWIEEVWNSYFCCNRSLEEFGPYIPLFVDWLDAFKDYKAKTRSYQKNIKQVFSLLKPEFLYVTVSQSGFGLEGGKSKWEEIPPNLMILSATSRGHVVIPLLMRELRWRPSGEKRFTGVFSGLIKNHKIRQDMDTVLKGLFPRDYYSATRVKEFTEDYRDAKVILSPRGTSRGAFRTWESLQIGAVVLAVHDHEPWIAYNRTDFHWEKMIFHTDLDELVLTYRNIVKMPMKEIMEMENAIKEKHEFFTYMGLMRQIEWFLIGDQRSYLRCGNYQAIM